MPLIASEGEGKQRQQPPAGTHVARCVSVIDLGTQPGVFGSKRKVRISWETPDETAVFDSQKGEQPFMLSKEYTLSLYEKANLRHDLESWRGKAFIPDELKGFDIFDLLGTPCLISVIHKPSADGSKVYANVSSISKLAKGMTIAAQINPSVKYSIEDGANAVFDSLPGWLQKKILDADESKNVGNTEPAEATEAADENGVPW